MKFTDMEIQDRIYELLGAVIKDALFCLSHRDASKKKLSKSQKGIYEKEYRDAKNFIFLDNRLENFIDYWRIPVEPSYIRKHATKILKKGGHNEMRYMLDEKAKSA